MDSVRNTKHLPPHDRSARERFFYIVVGLGTGATLIAFALQPHVQVAGLAYTGALWVVMLAFRLFRAFQARSSRTATTGATVAYLVIVAVVLIGSGVVTVTVIRGSDGWSPLAWLLGGLVFVVISSGAWAVGGSVTDESTPDQ
jgi:hypothetical protein